ncbi:MAG: hypothetical protein H6945_12860 [Zoogloeaceae bacterium]|nr:hypothetical protein [Rhodocyclaceae bacterium]MCP5236615.1 hypothetical protein [Zoogloeaceae bacterium]
MAVDHEGNPARSVHRPAVPVAGRILLTLGITTLVAGVAVMAGPGRQWHPLLAASRAGLALIVSAVALIGSAAFPIVLARLAAEDRPDIRQ